MFRAGSQTIICREASKNMNDSPRSNNSPRSPRSPTSEKLQSLKRFKNLHVFGSKQEQADSAWALAQRHKTKWFGLLHPDTNISGFYDFFNICLLLYLLCTLPYNLAYSVTPRDDEPQFYFDIFVDACLAFDIMMSMCRYSYDSKTRELITDAAYIRTTYLQSWFIIDLVQFRSANVAPIQRS